MSYANYFEWSDSQEHKEDLIGYFVTLDDTKIKIAGKNDYILGVTCEKPHATGIFIDNDRWYEYMVDEFGRDMTKLEEVTYIDRQLMDVEETYIDENGEEQVRVVKKFVEVEKTAVVESKIANPLYDRTAEPYYRSKLLSEVGLIGQLRVRDDGTCVPNGYCTATDEGIATATDDPTGYRVMSRISNNVIRILFR